jgi:hypothetical protein
MGTTPPATTSQHDPQVAGKTTRQFTGMRRNSIAISVMLRLFPMLAGVTCSRARSLSGAC